MVEDMLLDLLLVGGAPVVAHGSDVASGVVIEVIYCPSVAVAVENVVAPVVFGAEVDAVEVDGGDAPEVP